MEMFLVFNGASIFMYVRTGSSNEVYFLLFETVGSSWLNSPSSTSP